MDRNIFISYGHEDYQAAKRLFDDLRHAGLESWLDRECLLGGQKWEVAVRRAIQESRFFIALLSTRSVTRKGFLHTELREAIKILKEYPDSDTFIIPVRLDKCTLPHEKLWELQRVDMFPNWDDGVKRILKAIGISHQPLTAFVAVQLRQLDTDHFARAFKSANGKEWIVPCFDKPPLENTKDPLFKFLSSNRNVEHIHWVYGDFDIMAIVKMAIVKAENVTNILDILSRIREFPNVLNTSTTLSAGKF